MGDLKDLTEEQLKKIELIKHSEQYPELLKAYGELCDSDLLAVSVMGEVLLGLSELSIDVDKSGIREYVDQIEEEKNKDKTGI